LPVQPEGEPVKGGQLLVLVHFRKHATSRKCVESVCEVDFDDHVVGVCLQGELCARGSGVGALYTRVSEQPLGVRRRDSHQIGGREFDEDRPSGNRAKSTLTFVQGNDPADLKPIRCSLADSSVFNDFNELHEVPTAESVPKQVSDEFTGPSETIGSGAIANAISSSFEGFSVHRCEVRCVFWW
jgi:hypothetical protein